MPETNDENIETSDETKEEETTETTEETNEPSENETKVISELAQLKREHKKLQKETSKETEEKVETETKETKSDEPDYAKLAFLDQKGVEHPDDKKIVFDEAERLKLPLTDILQMEHIKTKLQESKDGREAKEGMPKGKGRTGQASREDVDYYMDKPDELPEDQELAGKVVEARLNKIETSSKFSDVPFIG